MFKMNMMSSSSKQKLAKLGKCQVL